MVSIVTLLMLIFVVCNLVVDMLYAALDPRIPLRVIGRSESHGKRNH